MSGAALVLDASRIPTQPAETGNIQIAEDAITGGITKWLYCHLSPLKCSQTVLPPDVVLAVIHPNGEWGKLLRKADPRFADRVDEGALAQALLPMCETMDTTERRQTRCNSTMLSHGIARGACTCALFNQLRRLFLAAMGANRLVIKTDYTPVQEIWSVLPPKTMQFQLTMLAAARYTDPQLEAEKKWFCEELRQWISPC